MNRCEECGSWEAECMSDDPVDGCGCARCANAEVRRLRKALEEREGDMHLRIRAGYDKTVADSWRARVAEVERDAAHWHREYLKLLGERDNALADAKAYKQDFEAELAGNAVLRERFGAREDETMFAFHERLVRERDEARAELALAKALHAAGGRVMLTDEQLAELERLDGEATPGPWAWDGWRLALGNDTAIVLRASARVDPGVANAALIAAARNALPELVAEVRRLRVYLGNAVERPLYWVDSHREAVALVLKQIESLSRDRDAELAQARREGAAEMRERAANALTCDCDVNSRQCDEMQEWASTIRALPLPGDE